MVIQRSSSQWAHVCCVYSHREVRLSPLVTAELARTDEVVTRARARLRNSKPSVLPTVQTLSNICCHTDTPLSTGIHTDRTYLGAQNAAGNHQRRDVLQPVMQTYYTVSGIEMALLI